MNLPDATEVPDTDCKMNDEYGQCVLFISCPYYFIKTEIQTNLVKFCLALPKRFPMLLNPGLPNACHAVLHSKGHESTMMIYNNDIRHIEGEI